ncbi:hypothetical protein Ae201684_011491 [Aphanomyces euteiches]|uniref:Uncharacterized protein n=1 Tax=Aphanomyces euteiches TaxID=100861 RepID=A0A6G0WUP1_9STRA|nr:hypothetical protein Ae201684_011491 [Aphanomyces euteiches]
MMTSANSQNYSREKANDQSSIEPYALHTIIYKQERLIKYRVGCWFPSLLCRLLKKNKRKVVSLLHLSSPASKKL